MDQVSRIIAGPACLALAACSTIAADHATGDTLAAYPHWTLSDAVTFPHQRTLLHAEDGVMLDDGRLIVGDAQHGLVFVAADGSKAPFGNFADAGFIAGPASGWSNPNGVALEPDGRHLLVADIVEGKIFRANIATGDVELVYDHAYGVNTAVADGHGTIWFTQSTRNASGPDAEGRMYAAVDRPMGDGALYRLRMDEGGAWQAIEVAGGFDFANGVAVDEARGRIYVAESLGGAVRVFSVDFASGEVREELRPLPIFSPDNVELDASGNLWVAQPFANAVSVIDPDTAQLRRVFDPTPEHARQMEAEINRRLAAGEGLAALLGPELFGPLPGVVTGVILSPHGDMVYVSGLGDALIRLTH